MADLLSTKSLAATLDSLSEAHFFNRPVSKDKKGKAAKWIASRQGLKGSYASMFAPTEFDFNEGFKVFTGERVKTGAATAHILGEEACRSLLLLKVRDKSVTQALKRATDGILGRLGDIDNLPGMYCCGICTCSYWRHFTAGGLKNGEKALISGMNILKSYRIGSSKWGRFPFYYALLALSEIDLPGAKAEMRYAAPILERLVKRAVRNDKYDIRRHALAERILEKC